MPQMNFFNKVSVVISLFAFLFLLGVAFGTSKSAEAYEFCAVGDITSTTVMSKMKAYPCQINVLLGDYYDKYSFVKGFIEGGVPVLAATGNHDECAEVARSDNINGESCTYGFRWKGVGFLILNTERSISVQKERAVGLLDKWQNDTTIHSIAIAQHMPAITTSSAHHKESEAKGYRTFFTEMVDTHDKIGLLLFGHNHGYQVCKPDNPKVLVITDGTGGRSPYPWGSARDDNCDTNLSGSKYNGFSIIDIQADGEIKFRHVNAAAATS